MKLLLISIIKPDNRIINRFYIQKYYINFY